MKWIRSISAQLDDPPEIIGGKAHGLVVLHRLGLPVPDAVVVTTDACRAFLRSGRLPDELLGELTAAVLRLGPISQETVTPNAVSVRSGAATSMPGMMQTILGVPTTTRSTPPPHSDEPDEGLGRALQAVFSSWNSPRARTYRELHGIPHDLGTAAIVQVMVYGDRDDHSGSGVVFSRDPNTGEHALFGEVLPGRPGDEVVSGRSDTWPLRDLAEHEPSVWANLTAAVDRAERHLRDVCYLEFTYESGRLWLLQFRPGRLTGAAALRVAVNLADEGLIERQEALLRITPRHLEQLQTTRVVLADDDIVLGHGVGACPGVVTGRVAVTSDSAVRQSPDGPVVLVRPETSPHDMRGLAVAAGVVTGRGGPACHAAVVARALGRPAVVGASQLSIDPVAGTMTAADRTIGDGTTITIDGTTGHIVLGEPRTITATADRHYDRLLAWADDVSEDFSERPGPQRLRDAHAKLQPSKDT